MAKITDRSTLLEVAATVSDALRDAGILATLSGGAVVCIYTDNEYQSKDLDFVTAAMNDELLPALAPLGFVHTGISRMSQYSHPLVEWFIEFPPAPISFGSLYVDHKDCTTIELNVGRLRLITPTQSVMDRLAAAIHWSDAQSREQAVLVATHQSIDWTLLGDWFVNEGESTEDFERFRALVMSKKKSRHLETRCLVRQTTAAILSYSIRAANMS